MGGEPAHAVKAAPSEILGYDFRAAHVNYLCRWLTTSQALFEVRNQQSFQFRFEDISILIAFDHIRGLRQVSRICRLSKPRALALQNELLGCNVHKNYKTTHAVCNAQLLEPHSFQEGKEWGIEERRRFLVWCRGSILPKKTRFYCHFCKATRRLHVGTFPEETSSNRKAQRCERHSVESCALLRISEEFETSRNI